MNQKIFLDRLSEKARKSLVRRRNSAGLLHLFTYCLCLACLSGWVVLRMPGWPVMLVLSGVMLAFLFTLQHECTHNTPFSSRWLNTLIGHITAIILFQPFLWFRHFHMAHHRHTNIKGKDPELAGLPKPESWPELLLHLSTITYWRDKVVLLWQTASGSNFADYVPKHARRAVQTEAIFMLTCYAGLAALIWAGQYWIVTLWLLPLIIGFPFLRLYLLAEHGRCPQVVNMFENSRTVYTNKLICFLAWNMPYHTEHHIFPAVPFYKLPKLHKLTKPHLKYTSDGYSDFSKSFIQDFQK